MATDLIRYDLLVQEALKGVVRRVLSNAVREGLPGDHHFYISFRTTHPGVRLSQRLRERYPQDMTIVLQHQFENLTVTEAAFEVGLSFSQIPERLRIPFDALSGFFDPSVQFGLKFEASEEGEKAAAPDTSEPTVLPTGRSSVPVLGARRTASKTESAAEPAAPAQPAPAKTPARKSPKRVAEAAASDEEAATGEVVSLDAFRKKN